MITAISSPYFTIFFFYVCFRARWEIWEKARWFIFFGPPQVFWIQVWRVGAEEVGFTGDSLGLRVGDGDKGYIGGIRVGGTPSHAYCEVSITLLALMPLYVFPASHQNSLLIYSGMDTPTSARYVADTFTRAYVLFFSGMLRSVTYCCFWQQGPGVANAVKDGLSIQARTASTLAC